MVAAATSTAVVAAIVITAAASTAVIGATTDVREGIRPNQIQDGPIFHRARESAPGSAATHAGVRPNPIEGGPAIYSRGGASPVAGGDQRFCHSTGFLSMIDKRAVVSMLATH